MGGGVSLGTFSGAALSEVLKLAVLYGHDGGQRYERVVVDVFSGASAGAMALALMLRALAHRSPQEDEDARRALEQELGEAALAALPPSVASALIAAQAVQDLQARAWAKEISLARLLEKTAGTGGELGTTAGIFNRGAVDDIARALLVPQGQVSFGGRQLLADRVLFACTLANTSAIVYDARRDLSAIDIGLVALSDGLRSAAHRELRVFDLSFKPVSQDDTQHPERYPRRWCRYHVDVEEKGRIGALDKKRTWAKIAATAVASGAFPFAFEPVVLTRDAYEYGDLWPEALAGQASYPFTFVDGGTFNNEPIREAFRLASFIDSQTPGRSYDRRIIFVDPNVSARAISLRAPVHQRHQLLEPRLPGKLDGFGVALRSSLDRLVAHAPSVATAFYDEATVVEADRIFATRHRFELRDQLRSLIGRAIPAAPTPAPLQELAAWCAERLASDASSDIAPGRSAELRRALARIIQEQGSELAPLADHIDTFLTFTGTEKPEHEGLWLRALFYLSLDLLSDLEGKQTETRLIAIAPIVRPAEPWTDEGKPIALPGGALAGFAGFMSAIPARYELALGRFCAWAFLEACGTIKAPDRQPPPRLSAAEEAALARDIEAGLGALAERVRGLVRDAHLIRIFPGLDAILSDIVSKIAASRVRRVHETQPSRSIELRIEVPSRRFELDGKGPTDPDLGPLAVGPPEKPWVLITFGAHDGARWTGPHLDAEAQQIAVDLDGLGPLPDRTFCRIELPSRELVQGADLWPHPILKTRIEEADRGRVISAGKWELLPGVEPCERTLEGPHSGSR